MQKSQKPREKFNKNGISKNSKHIKKPFKPNPNIKPQFNRKQSFNKKFNKKQEVSNQNRSESTNQYFRAKEAYEKREQQLIGKGMTKGELSLMKKIMDSGTHADKISALSINVRDNPKLSLGSLAQLLMMGKDHNRRKRLIVIGSLKELFLEVLLPKKKLNSFQAALQGKQNPSEDDLVNAYYEHRLRELYQAYLKILENGLHDDLDYYKENSITILGELLKSKPEQEEVILNMLVNKFGDKSKKFITSLNKVMHDLLFRHRSMTQVVAKEVESFIGRANISNDAIFYAIHFLCSLNFQLYDVPTLIYLSKLFFQVFFKLVDAKEQENEKVYKLQGVLLKAINKIFPKIYNADSHAKTVINEHIDQLFRMSHQCPLKIRIQAMILLFQFLKVNSSLSDRYFKVLYEIVIQLSQIYYQLVDEEVKTSTSIQPLFDLLFNALKDDYSVPRIQAFIKRLLQTALQADTAFIIAALMFVYRMFTLHPGTTTLLNFSLQNKLLDDEGEEHFHDVPDEEDEIQIVKEIPKPNKIEEEKQAKADGLDEEQRNQKQFSTDYDPYKRDPQFAYANNSALYELLVLKEHYHPSVKLYANALFDDLNKNQNLFEYKGNPLLDYSLSNFLDRIAFKKPKKIPEAKQNKMRMSKLSAPVSESFAMKENIREDEEYFIKYFENKTQKKKDRKKTIDFGDEEDIDAYADELFEKQLKDKEVDEDDDDIFDEDEQEGDMDEEEGADEEEEEGFGDLLENIGQGERDDFEFEEEY